MSLRSPSHILPSPRSVKSWEPTSPDALRPNRCPRCQRAGSPVGRSLSIVGHGLRERHVRGLAASGEAFVQLRVRRYRCRACRAILTVVPREIVARRHLSALVVGWTLALIGLAGRSLAAVRRKLTGTSGARSGWATAERWAGALRRGELLARLGPLAGDTVRDVVRATALRLRDLAAGLDGGGDPLGAVAVGAVVAAHDR